MRPAKRLLTFLSFIFIIGTAKANVSLPEFFSSHMVLQQNSEVKLWGWGNPTEKVAVTTSWSTDTLHTVASNQCKWSVVLSTPCGSQQAHTITIQGYNTIILDDILMGEVWLLSGQSNMEWCARWGFNNADEVVNNANRPNIRLFTVSRRTAENPIMDLKGNWKACSPETVLDFSAIGYIFGRTLQDSLDNVPVGLINTAWGGSPIEIWVPEEEITQDEYLLEESKKLEDMAWTAREPGRAYNAMIAPLMPLNIAGVLWYQGETNAANPLAYAEMLQNLVESWREGFQKDFPFYYAQIAPWNGYGPAAGAQVRESQRRALDLIPDAGMVVVSDIGDTVDIHPRNKIDAGIRFANLALNKTYGKEELPTSGPLYQFYSVADKKVTVTFEHGEGLYADGPALSQFEVRDSTGTWYPAKAKIKKNTVEVYSKAVKNPKGVRFAWSSTATPGLFNKDHLPASCFTTSEDMK
ncbi:hypothetical protein KDU71_00670 [Carboxylicivirga sediminis]|uniref:Sialate O-acetylesterase domain-containing protein n=1 Tax=Carboxylicivirga sediminis TaxID=2006564 RepID=A0A941IVI6_9BACT|nr:sialate O-acetylesterase [Carboxylicivirga sediminis]MBR8534058.1 hypothetical protein [Carboxylicivirga sediminis]